MERVQFTHYLVFLLRNLLLSSDNVIEVKNWVIILVDFCSSLCSILQHEILHAITSSRAQPHHPSQRCCMGIFRN